MSPPDPFLAMRRRVSSFSKRSTEDGDGVNTGGEKQRQVINGGSNGVQNGAQDHQGVSHNGMV